MAASPRTTAAFLILLTLASGLAGCTDRSDTPGAGTDPDAFTVHSSPATWEPGLTITYTLRENPNATRILLVNHGAERVPGEAWWLISVADFDNATLVRGRDVLMRQDRLELGTISSTLNGEPPAIADTYPSALRVGDAWTLPTAGGTARYSITDAGTIANVAGSGPARAVHVLKTTAEEDFLARSTFAEGWSAPVILEEGLTTGGTVHWDLTGWDVQPLSETLERVELGGPFESEAITTRLRSVTGWSAPTPFLRYERDGIPVNASMKPRLEPALRWIRDATPQDSIIAAWWDDGALVEGYGFRRTLAVGPSPELLAAIPRPSWIDPHALPGMPSQVLEVLGAIFLSDPGTAATVMEAVGIQYLLIDGGSVPIDNPSTPTIDVEGLLAEMTTTVDVTPGDYVVAQRLDPGAGWVDATEPGPAQAARILYKPAFFNTTLYRAWAGPTPPGEGLRDGGFWESVLRRPAPGWDSGGRMRLVYADSGARVLEAFTGAILSVNVTYNGARIENAYAEVFDDAGDVLLNMLPKDAQADADPRAYDVRHSTGATDANGTLVLRVPYSAERGLTIRFPEFDREYAVHVTREQAKSGDVIRAEVELGL